MAWFHAHNLAPSAVYVTDYISNRIIRHSYGEFHNGFEQGRPGLQHAFFETIDGCYLESYFRGINLVRFTVIEAHLYIDNRVSGKWTGPCGFP